MKIESICENGLSLAVISSDEPVMIDGPSALDLAMTVKYQTGASSLILDKRAVCEEFFILSSGLAGDILQKYINYHIRAAIYGDYSRYTSKPLRDFIYESNQGTNFFFTATKEEAVQKLTKQR